MKALILNSAHNKYPMGSDPWVQATVNAVETLARSGSTILCSSGPSQWDLVTCLAGKNSAEIELIVKIPKDRSGGTLYEALLEDYNLDRNRTHPLFLPRTPGLCQRTKELWRARDLLAIQNAQIIYPVSIRPEGRLSQMINRDDIKSKINSDFRSPWTQGGFIPSYRLEGRTVNPLPDDTWFIHWTRASQGPWNGEKPWQYYHDLIGNPGIYVRSAEATLVRILTEKRIRGSAWKLPAGERAVAFTSLSLEKTLPLMRWRKRFVRYTFEPYGIGVRQSTLIDLGAREVVYVRGDTTAGDSDSLFFHAPGILTDWSGEKEWRYRGDLSLHGIDSHDLIAVVPDAGAEKSLMEKNRENIPVHRIFKD
ncbi:hypothetical protein LLG96_12155 [bacterium]|nr:hypothetical protein [bacterium]